MTLNYQPSLSLVQDTGHDKIKLVVIWFAITAYNLFKPYHMDDTAHLEIARWIAAHPLHPMSGILNWNGVDAPIYRLNQPALYFYLLSVWGSLFGYGEATMHALQSLFALSAILLFYRIALRLVPHNALWLAAMLALGPSFVVEQNLMVDVPLLSLWLLFFDALILGADADEKGQPRRFLVASLACAAALLVKYSSLVLLPILIVVIIYERRWRLVWAVLVPLATLVAWSLFNYFDYGGIHIIQRSVGLGYAPLRRFVAWMITIGAITPFGLVAMVRLVPWLRRRGPTIYAAATLFFVLLVAAVVTGWLDEINADRVLRTAFLVNAGAMAYVVATVLVRRLADRRAPFPPNPADARILILMLWIAGHLSFYSLFAPFMAARHLLLVLPAVLLLGAVLWPTRLPRVDATFGLTASLVLSVALGWSDWRFASFFRDEATVIRATLPPDARIWFTGHWGWQWYATRANLRPVEVARSQFSRGDFLVIPRDVTHERLRHPPQLVLFRTDRKGLGIGDIFCTANWAQFYMTEFTDGPWQLTRYCKNIIDIYRVEGHSILMVGARQAKD